MEPVEPLEPLFIYQQQTSRNVYNHTAIHQGKGYQYYPFSVGTIGTIGTILYYFQVFSFIHSTDEQQKDNRTAQKSMIYHLRQSIVETDPLDYTTPISRTERSDSDQIAQQYHQDTLNNKINNRGTEDDKYGVFSVASRTTDTERQCELLSVQLYPYTLPKRLFHICLNNIQTMD